MKAWLFDLDGWTRAAGAVTTITFVTWVYAFFGVPFTGATVAVSAIGWVFLIALSVARDLRAQRSGSARGATRQL
jgi:hypothetical protein